MIYEYPKEFVVPVVYADDLRDKPIYRDWEVEYIQLGGLGSELELHQDEGFILNDYENNTYENNEKKFYEFNMDLLQEPYKENMLSYSIGEDNPDGNHVKEILKDIDNEYAKSETSRK
ncbi:hypothetical protein CDLVIII_5403 [Clostridium sp. DL-VIII]|uniref:hypothetical protein n=1 Tax=Clostridium sp. DL-VIII TaxID=641107 RepID=UPI00023B041A|nr:hypothetical protein [Clostridium sp. DL-VIII]EHJ01885.1 hypothetical protein CDLVIII_5403 [Clostridium sp. DL-VIII]